VFSFRPRDESVVGSGPAFLGHIKPRIDRSSQVLKTADAGADVGRGIGADYVVITESQTLTLAVFSAAVFAESCAERILRQTQELPESKPSKQRAFAVDRLIDSCHIFIDVATSAGRLYEIRRC